MSDKKRRSIIRANLTEFVLPPIDDGLVLGKLSPIGHVAVGKALSLLSTTSFDHIAIEDDVIGDILVRTAIMRKISREQLIVFVLNEIKPLMGPEEIIHLDIKVEISLESKQS
ncbi:MAG: hypothetical protein A2342_00460 [Gallionellales bacterium RIFOXYB12_FULL_54_9]|nr:MAG: hypothetical protein A2342_00460 [Gallionellales bacterium RIFOXYB12_FULL_54_9]